MGEFHPPWLVWREERDFMRGGAMISDIQRAFDDAEDEFLEFDRIKNPPCGRPDVCAMILLDRLVPGNKDMVDGAEHDQIWLSVEPEELAKVATQEDIVYLRRCGVWFDPSIDSLTMFV